MMIIPLANICSSTDSMTCMKLASPLLYKGSDQKRILSYNLHLATEGIITRHWEKAPKHPKTHQCLISIRPEQIPSVYACPELRIACSSIIVWKESGQEKIPGELLSSSKSSQSYFQSCFFLIYIMTPA